ncbi:MAG: 3-keto-disaccharide hydrolase, partial [Tangfeifania sp.]
MASVVFVSACNSKPKSQESDEKSATAETEENWIQLFNGKDLNDWQIKFTGFELGENYNNTFRVEDGLLRVRYDEWDEWGAEFGHIFYKDEFSHYRLRVEYRFVDEQVKGGPGWAFRNNGLMLHGQPAETMEIDQEFPTSIEVQLLGGNGTDERSTMNLCTPGTNVVMDGELVEQHCMTSNSDTYHGDQWVTVEVEVHGGEIIRHFVEGEEVMQYEKPQLDPRDQYYDKMLTIYGDQ